ncbi:hypothetical protein ACQJBY_025861 [Aegilops geniculata]
MAHITTIFGVVMAAAMLKWPLLAGAEISPAEAQGMPNCDITCGNMSVPYPFGMGPARCYWPGFNLTCDRKSNPPRLLLGDGTLQVQDFHIAGLTYVTVVGTGDIKFDGNGEGTLGGGLTADGPYTISTNQLIVTGCNVQATLKNGDVTVSSCSSVCTNGDGLSEALSTLEEGRQCTGNGCCQSDIVFDPADVAETLVHNTSYDVQLKWIGWNRIRDQQWPAYVFVSLYDWFSRKPVFHELLRSDGHASVDAMQVPIWLDWEVVGHGAECSSVCKSKHSNCGEGNRGYMCSCKIGYRGNPYITDGCKDIDKCNDEGHDKCYGDCINSDGSYDCRCPPGTYGDAARPGGCRRSVSEDGWFDQQRFSSKIFQQHESEMAEVQVPQVLQWEVTQGLPRPADCPAEVAGKLCKSKNSNCKRGSRGYLCQCMDGYDKPGSNPYLAGGCKGGGKPLSTGIYLSIGVAVGACIILFVLAGSFTHKKFKHRRAQMLKQKFFEKNRGQLLQQLVSQRADIAERMIITLNELEKATNRFDKARELGGGGHGTVYKGILSDLHVVAIKKPKAVIQKEIDEFINEVAILSQINHRNVVKLYGCCLETEVPMLVYEFISNGTLYDHLHVDGPKSLSWNDRLRIATETARSLAYLHSTASVPIIHRDIKSVNILLDDTLTAKVADFGASRYVPLDRSGITTRVQGTRGYLDPGYFYTGRLTGKSDVYSFGVLLLELLTRKKPFSYISSEDEGLVTHFSTLFTQGKLSEILDPQVMEEGGSEMEEVAALAAMCIKLRGEDRPSMKQVEIKLEGTQASRGHEGGNVRNCPQTADGSGIEELSRQYSMEEEFALSSRYPR